MSRRVRAEAFPAAGLGDYVCPPSGVAVLFHNLKTPSKTIEFKPGERRGQKKCSRNILTHHDVLIF